MTSCSSWRVPVPVPADDCCSVCFVETKYACLICELPVCNNCSTFESNEETPGWVMAKSVSYCLTCRKPENKDDAVKLTKCMKEDLGASR